MKQRFQVRDLTLIALFAALTSVMAQLSVPMPGGLPPVTGQTFAVMLAGLILGSKKGAMSQIIYILLGLAGFPVFANAKSGFAVLVGPTGGFLWGFVIGAYIMGLISEAYPSRPLTALAAAALVGGVIAVYVPGILQLSYVYKLPLTKAATAMLPYIPGDLIKVAASSVLARKVLAALVVKPA